VADEPDGEAMSTSDDLRWVDVAEPELGISLQAPEGWSRSSTPVFPLQLLAPFEHGYRTNVGFSHERFGPPGAENFLAYLDDVIAERAHDYQDFAELHRGPLVIDGHPCNAIHYRWHPPAPLDRDVEQLLAMIVVEPGLALEVDATALAQGDDPLRRARQILSTVQFVARGPERPAGLGDAPTLAIPILGSQQPAGDR
jgi:hypothetical protein